MGDKTERRYLISIDGGGSKTGVCVYDCIQRTRRSTVSGGGNYKTHGIEAVREHILTCLHELMPESEDIPAETVFIVMGISGCDSPQDIDVYTKIMSDMGFSSNRMFICNDAELIFHANSDVPGICIVAGTGTIALAFTGTGKTYRAGGWGAPISDEGSGYWIGAEMIRNYLNWIDGIGSYNDFFRKFPETIRCNSDEEAAAVLACLDPAKVAEWAKPVFDSVSENKLCQKIIEKAAEKAAVLTSSVYLRGDFFSCRDLSIVESGGLFQNEHYENYFRKSLSEILPIQNYHFIHSEGIPAEDGIRLAGKMANNLVTTQSCD